MPSQHVYRAKCGYCKGKQSKTNVTKWCRRMTFGIDGTAVGSIRIQAKSATIYHVNRMVTLTGSTQVSNPTRKEWKRTNVLSKKELNKKNYRYECTQISRHCPTSNGANKPTHRPAVNIPATVRLPRMGSRTRLTWSWMRHAGFMAHDYAPSRLCSVCSI